MPKNLKIFTGNANPAIAREICEYLKVPLGAAEVKKFSDGEISVEIGENVRGADVFVIQPTCTPVNDNLMELLITIQTLRLDSAARITAVVPYLCYGRSDKKDQPRVPITARLVADMIEVAGADRYITLDLHAGQIQGFFSIPGDVLTSFYILMNYIKDMESHLVSPVIVTADLGFAKKARNFAAGLNAPMAFIEKRRIGNDAKSQALTIIGDVYNRDAIIVDDEVDTGGSIVHAVNIVKDNGARNIYVVFVHPVLSLNAAERLAALPVREFITTDTMPIPPQKLALFNNRLTVLSIAPLLGEVILRANQGRSVGEMFNE